MNIHLSDLRQYCLEKNIPLISLATEKFLQELVSNLDVQNFLEIGSAIGYSTLFMASLLDKKSLLMSFEISYPAYLQAMSNIFISNIYNIKLYPFDFLKINLEYLLPKSLDLIFIDAQKSQYGDYMYQLDSYIKSGTPIVIDDVIKYHHKLATLYEYLDKSQTSFQIKQLEDDDGVMLINL